MKKSTTVGDRNIAALFDAGSFAELGAFVRRPDGELTGVICGYGAIGGKLVYAFSQDSDRRLGAFDAYQAEKIASLYAMAIKNGAPVIGIFDSAGASVCDGASVLSGYGKLLKVVSDASGVIPQIAIVTGVCAGLAATVAAMFDLTVTVKDQAQLFVNAPFLLGQENGAATAAAANGMATVEAESEADAMALAAKLVKMLPASVSDGVTVENSMDDPNRLVSVSGKTGAALAMEIADADSVVELGAAYAPEMFVGLASFGGVTAGVIASNVHVCNGVITADAAKKAARMISFCDAFSIPVVTLVDSIGVDSAKEAEDANLAAQLAKLAMAYATAEVAKITVVVGKAYGAAFALMGAKSLGADVAYALREAAISTMAPSAAVAFLWNDRITESVTRADLEAEWVSTEASVEFAARDGAIDDVIDSKELRQRICSAVYMLLAKGDARTRRHPNLPL